MFDFSFGFFRRLCGRRRFNQPILEVRTVLIYPATTPDSLLRLVVTPPRDAEGNPTTEFEDLRFEAAAEGTVSITELRQEPAEYRADYRLSFGGVGPGTVSVRVLDSAGNLLATGSESFELIPGDAVSPAIVSFSIFQLPAEDGPAAEQPA